jgi:hypothetical protein
MQTNVVHPPKDRIITQVWSQQRVQTGWCLQQVGRVNHACGTQTFDERILNNSFKCAGVAFNSESASALFGQRLQSINDVPPAHPAIGPRWYSREYRNICRSLIYATFVKFQFLPDF